MGRLVKPFGHVVAAESLNARIDAQQIRADAQRDSQELLARARAEAESVRTRAYEAGLAASEAAVHAEFAKILGSALAEADRIRRAAVPTMRAVALRMAERIVGRALTAEPDLMSEMALRALKTSGTKSGPAVIRVHPDDCARLQAHQQLLAAPLEPGSELRIVADEAVERFGCVVDTPTGRLDARLQTQLAILERAVFGATESEPT